MSQATHIVSPTWPPKDELIKDKGKRAGVVRESARQASTLHTELQATKEHREEGVVFLREEHARWLSNTNGQL